MDWHSKNPAEIFDRLQTSENGLTEDTARQILEKEGLNELERKKKKPLWWLFLAQFKDFMILILLAAAIISGIIGETTDAIIIVIIVILNAVVGFVQEYRAEKAMEALTKMAAPVAKVKRNNQIAEVPSSELVRGDVVLLEAGDVVPADLRLIEAHAVRLEESSLTGESVPVDKTSDTITEADVSIGDRFNMAYKTTLVANGRGVGVVVNTGMYTEIGKIAGLLQMEAGATPLQKRMMDFGKKLSYLILVICALLFGIGILRGEEPWDMLMVAISLAVAAIPEALPALITIALAVGAKRLVTQNALIRKLTAVETLGSVTFICSDKTGTLTQNKMTVTEVLPNGEAEPEFEYLPTLELAMLLNTDVRKSPDGELTGDPTEIALVAYSQEKYPDLAGKLKQTFPREDEIPFDSDRKRMTTIHKYDGKYIVFTKGAVESISSVLHSRADIESIQQEAHDMAKRGVRVLAFGYKVLDRYETPVNMDSMETNLEFAGLVGMIDPPREEAKMAIEECKTAGINVVMITGDHKETAMSIAADIGILSGDDLVLSGTELERLSQEELKEKVARVRVYARVSPEQKLNIVRSLQSKKHFVAMTGDGVNDAPSLKAADIGVAMGITGTDVSKEAAHMILLDDNFATIVKAVREGRRIYDNIRKFIKYILTCNSAEILTIFLAPIIGLPIPLLPIHILWINLVTDGLPGLALSSEKEETDIMKRPPRSTTENLFAGGTGFHIIWVGALMAAVTLGVQAWSMEQNLPWQTMVFTVLSLSQLGHVFAIRSDREFIFKKGIFSNPQLALALVFTFLLQLGVIYFPFCNKIFHTEPLSLTELLICIAISAVMFHAVELEKLIRKMRSK